VPDHDLQEVLHPAGASQVPAELVQCYRLRSSAGGLGLFGDREANELITRPTTKRPANVSRYSVSETVKLSRAGREEVEGQDTQPCRQTAGPRPR